jgi:hypothetical protein
VAFDATALSCDGHIHRGMRTVFVAAHDPAVELRGSSVEEQLMRWTYRD